MVRWENLSLFFGDTGVFERGNVSAAEGEILVITGASGSGKSSFIKAVNGIIPEVEKGRLEGDISLCGESLLGRSIEARSFFVSTVFQNPKTQFFCIDTRDEIAFGLENRGVPKAEILRIIGDKTEKLKTKHLLGRNIFTLSGGEKQLVAITATSCMENQVYLLDEPSSSLDRTGIEWLKNTLLSLKEQGKTVIVAEHRLYYLMDILDVLCVMADGTFHVFDKRQLEEEGDKIREKFHLRNFAEYRKEECLKDRITKICVRNERMEAQTGMGLECRGIRCAYGNQVVLDMDIGFKTGITFITGENGVGKSTFIRKLAGTLKGSGRIYFNGRRVRRAYDCMAFVMQDVNYQIFTDSVEKEVMTRCADTDRVREILEKFDLWEKRNFHPQVLSGGEKQRLLIARAVLSDAPVIIFDEPTSGLGRKQMDNICDCLEVLSRQGKTVIVVTHDYELICSCTGRVMEFV